MYPEAELKSYGSFKSGFGDKSSDIDLTINIDWEAYVFKSEHEFKRLLDIFSS